MMNRESPGFSHGECQSPYLYSGAGTRLVWLDAQAEPVADVQGPLVDSVRTVLTAPPARRQGMTRWSEASRSLAVRAAAAIAGTRGLTVGAFDPGFPVYL